MLHHFLALLLTGFLAKLLIEVVAVHLLAIGKITNFVIADVGVHQMESSKKLVIALEAQSLEIKVSWRKTEVQSFADLLDNTV